MDRETPIHQNFGEIFPKFAKCDGQALCYSLLYTMLKLYKLFKRIVLELFRYQSPAADELRPAWLAEPRRLSVLVVLLVRRRMSSSCAKYRQSFSEENIWQLCKTIRSDDDARLKPFFAVFISNDAKMVSSRIKS